LRKVEGVRHKVEVKVEVEVEVKKLWRSDSDSYRKR
jgi:hypothetical protein